MNRQFRILSGVGTFVALLLTFGAGCAGREFAEVEGTVTLNGRPLADVEIVFVPAAAKGNNANACTDAQGRYKLRSEPARKNGTVFGPHRVTIVDLLAVPDLSQMGGAAAVGSQAAPTTRGPIVSRVPAVYCYPDQTPFQDVEVKPGKQTLDCDVKTRPR